MRLDSADMFLMYKVNFQRKYGVGVSKDRAGYYSANGRCWPYPTSIKPRGVASPHEQDTLATNLAGEAEGIRVNSERHIQIIAVATDIWG
jgi:hypothetical protein